MIARQCFQLQDFVKVVAINSLIKTYGEVQDGMSTIQTELGARLTCHLLLMLFQTVEGTYPNLNQQQSSLNGSGIKHRYVKYVSLYVSSLESHVALYLEGWSYRMRVSQSKESKLFPQSCFSWQIGLWLVQVALIIFVKLFFSSIL